jgi:hypothetical protein
MIKPLRDNLPRIAFLVTLLALTHFGLVDPASASIASAGAFVLNFETVSGSTLAVSVGVPAAEDAASYGALVWTAVGEITDLGGSLGRDYNIVEHSPIAQARVIQKKGSYRLGSQDLVMAWDQNDAGQDILRTAANDPDDIVSIRITKQSGDLRYYRAQVSKFLENFGTADNVNQGMVTLLRQTDVVMNPA